MGPSRSLFLTSFLAGGTAGAVTDLILFPLDTLKTRLQLRGEKRPPSGFFYRGLLSNMAGALPYATTYWSLYEALKLWARRRGVDDALVPGVLHAFQRADGNAPWDPACALFSAAGVAGADDTAVGDYSAATSWVDFDLPNDAAARACNASCWGSASCAAWDLIKVTPSSGKTRPTCGVFAAGAAVGCRADPNQAAGAKAPLPVPPPGGAVTQKWTLPLSWVGRAVRATVLAPTGEVPGGANVSVVARNLTRSGVVPGWAVRLEVD